MTPLAASQQRADGFFATIPTVTSSESKRADRVGPPAGAGGGLPRNVMDLARDLSLFLSVTQLEDQRLGDLSASHASASATEDGGGDISRRQLAHEDHQQEQTRIELLKKIAEAKLQLHRCHEQEQQEQQRLFSSQEASLATASRHPVHEEERSPSPVIGQGGGWGLGRELEAQVRQAMPFFLR
jgi:hypothetical protein